MTTTMRDQRVLVIGGSKYLGAAIAAKIAELGGRPIIGARDLARATAAADHLPGASAIAIDVTDEGSISAAATALGGIDHIIITASAHHNVPVTALERDGIISALEAKVVGPLLVAKHFAPLMPPTGSIVLFSGVAAWSPAPSYTVMGVTNGAVAFLASHLAKELAPIRVNAISPGIIDSGTWDGLGSDAKHNVLTAAAAGNLAGRAGESRDIAEAAAWLLSAGFVSGETIHVEGGARHA